MAERHQLLLLLHGAIILFIGLVFGLPFGVALSSDWGEKAIQAWRVAHSGTVAVGVMLLVIGSTLSRLVLPERAVQILVWSLVASAYGFTLALLLQAVAGVRGYRPTGSALNLAAFAFNVIGVLGAGLGVAVVIYGTCRALTAPTAE